MRKNNNIPKSEQVLLTSPSKIFSSLIGDMQRARRAIDMEFYIFEDDNVGRSVARLLVRKAHQGVRVRLLVDGYGSRNIGREMKRMLVNNGVEVVTYSSLSHLRNHRKMVIVDECVAHVGGVNIADRYVLGNRLGVWYDVELRFTGRDVETLAKLFQFDYLSAKGDNYGVDTPQGRQLSLHWSEADEGIDMLFERVAREVRNELIITTPYLFPTRRTIALLRDVVKRGVRVTIIAPERCDVWALDRLMRAMYGEIMDVGVELRLLRGAFVHAKMALVDGRKVVLGSANLDARSFHLNRELMLSTSDRGVCREARRFVTMLLDASTPPHDDERTTKVPRFVVGLLRSYL